MRLDNSSSHGSYRVAAAARRGGTVVAMPDGDAQADESDEALMLAYAAGNPQAFDRLYARHRQPLFRYLMRHTRQRELAHDLFQEAWGKLVDARLRYEPRARFQTFLYTIAHHCFIDHCRRSAVRPVSSATQADGSEIDWQGAAEDDPAHQAHTGELKQRLRAALDALPAEQRDAFLLHEEAGLTLEDIAAVTGVGRETVKSRLRYAVAKLRESMQTLREDSAS
jgi:RNA polymerase sigma-70 factor (ECF subfamily)